MTTRRYIPKGESGGSLKLCTSSEELARIYASNLHANFWLAA
jgi:hypothetical protein